MRGMQASHAAQGVFFPNLPWRGLVQAIQRFQNPWKILLRYLTP